jgi:predicted nucleotidyltransferase
MKNTPVHVAYKKILLAIILKHLPRCKIYLFGSRARNSHNQGADVDIALDAGAPLELKTIFKIKNEIEETNIPVFVDVIDVYSVSEEMKKQIKKDGILWNN